MVHLGPYWIIGIGIRTIEKLQWHDDGYNTMEMGYVSGVVRGYFDWRDLRVLCLLFRSICICFNEKVVLAATLSAHTTCYCK